MATSRKVLLWLSRQLPDWEKAGWVTAEGAEALRTRYGPLPEDNSGNRIFVALAALGAALIGGGIVLLFAYNWSEFGRPLRTFLSFLPLFLAQVVTAFTLINKRDSRGWSEGSAVALIAAIAACISLISQTCHVQGDLQGFLLTWIILGYPVLFILRSSLACFILLAQFIWWMSYSRFYSDHFYEAWLLFLPIGLAVFWLQWKEDKERVSLNVLTAITATVVLMVASSYASWHVWLLILVPWLSVLHLSWDWSSATNTASRIKVLTGVALLVLMFTGTYADFWDHPPRPMPLGELDPDWLVAVALYLAASCMLVARWEAAGAGLRLVLLAPFIALAAWSASIFGFGIAVTLAMNLLVLVLAFFVLFPAWRNGDPSGIRKGVSLLTVLLILRFFDYEFSLLARGIAFIIIGSGFLALNLYLHRSKGRSLS